MTNNDKNKLTKCVYSLAMALNNVNMASQLDYVSDEELLDIINGTIPFAEAYIEYANKLTQ